MRQSEAKNKYAEKNNTANEADRGKKKIRRKK